MTTRFRSLLFVGLLAWNRTHARFLAGAEPPTITKQDLWIGETDGYALYRIPRLTRTDRGTLLACCEARKSGKSDWGQIDIVGRRSTDAGKSWSPSTKWVNLKGNFPRNPAAVAQKLGKDGEVTINNPVLIAGPNGVVHLLFCVEYGRCFHQSSVDEGLSWSEPTEITATCEAWKTEYPWQVIATGPGHGIALRNGRLIVPVWMSTGTGGHAHRPSVTVTIYSDDSGKTWLPGSIAVANTKELVNPNVTTAAQLADGRVLLNVRNESATNRRLLTSSPNGVSDWSTPTFVPDLVEPICFGSILSWSPEAAAAPAWLVFSHPDNLDRAAGPAKPGQSRDRKKLSLHLSADAGQSWKLATVIEPGSSGYSDLTGAPGDSLYCLYERWGAGEPYRLTLATIPASVVSNAGR